MVSGDGDGKGESQGEGKDEVTARVRAMHDHPTYPLSMRAVVEGTG